MDDIGSNKDNTAVNNCWISIKWLVVIASSLAHVFIWIPPVTSDEYGDEQMPLLPIPAIVLAVVATTCIVTITPISFNKRLIFGLGLMTITVLSHVFYYVTSLTLWDIV